MCLNQKRHKKRIKLYNTLALPVLLYGSKTWTIKARDATRITAAEMKYMRRTAGYIWTDYKTNAQTAKELKITPVLDKLLEYKRNWIQHVNRMPRNRLPRVMKHYCWSQWPRGLRRGSTAARLQRLWVRIPPGAWMFVCCECCCQVEVYATSWSLVQRSPTDCSAS